MSTQSATTSPKVLTYRCNNSLVYVTAVDSYEKGLENALEAFPAELRDVKRECIAFYVNVTVQKTPQPICIAQSAWPYVIQSLANYEIVDVKVKSYEGAKMDAPPAYYSSSSLSPPARRTSRSPSPNASSSSTEHTQTSRLSRLGRLLSS